MASTTQLVLTLKPLKINVLSEVLVRRLNLVSASTSALRTLVANEFLGVMHLHAENTVLHFALADLNITRMQIAAKIRDHSTERRSA